MTMLVTHQSSAIHAFDHNACNRGSSFQSVTSKKPASLQYRIPAPVDSRQSIESRSSMPTLYDAFEMQPAIVMPCPKKASVLCVHAFLGGNPIASPTMTSPRWGLLPLPEDTQEDDAQTVLVENDYEDSFFEQAACAELIEIMSSGGSSRSSSKSSSPQSFNDNVEPSVSVVEPTVPFGLFEEYDAFFAASPIVRANNPLPNDQSFIPSNPEPATAEVAQHFQSYLARRHQAKVFDFNLNVDEAGETQAPSRTLLSRVGLTF